ncbi:MAG: translocation/assembly module TamB [Prevotellaceae bacterium]|jgi:hypothetical protein|nr:translocation/assembly module TamB [Prevotellaceae bacterium]
MRALKERIQKIVIIVLAALVAFPLSAYLLVKLPAVQGALVHRITATLSERLYPASVSVGAVHYALFTRLVVDDVLVVDRLGDTLLSVKEASFTLSAVSVRKKKLTVGHVHLTDGVFNLYSYASEEGETMTNIEAIVDHLKDGARRDTTTASASADVAWQVAVRHLTLKDFRFTFCNRKNPTNDPDPRVIDFKNLDLREIYIDARDLRLERDTLFFALRDVRFLEQSGYRLQHLTAERGHVCGTQAFLSNAELVDSYSHLYMKYYKMDYESVRSFSDYEEKVRMEADFDRAYFSFRTVGHMAKNFHINPGFYLTGTVGGTVDNLRSDRLEIRSDSLSTALTVKFRLTGLPHIDETMMYINVPELTSNARHLAALLQRFALPDTLDLSPLMAPLERIRLTGNFTGLYNDFVVHGQLHTGLGRAQFDISLTPGNAAQGVQLKGDVQAERFHVGKLLNVDPTIGEVSGQVSGRGTVRPARYGGVQLTAEGRLSQLDVAGYSYSAIDLKGTVDGHSFEGTVDVDDPNLQLAFSGGIRYPSDDDTAWVHMLDFDAQIHRADLTALQLNTRDSVSVLQASVHADYEILNHALDGVGNIAVTGIRYTGRNGVQPVGDIWITASRKASVYRNSLRADFLTVDYEGERPLSYFFRQAVDALLKQHLPALAGAAPSVRDTLPAVCTLKAVTKNSEAVTDIIVPELYIAPNTEATLTLLPGDSLALRLTSGGLAWQAHQWRNVSLAVDNNRRQSRATLKTDEALAWGQSVRNVTAQATAMDNRLWMQLQYDNKTEATDRGTLAAAMHFYRAAADSLLRAELQIRPSEIVITNNVWRIDSSDVVFNEKVHIRRFHVSNDTQEIMVDGCLSSQATDTLTLQLTNFDVANVNYLTGREGYLFNGSLSGRARMTSVYRSPRFFANLQAEEVLVNNHRLGRLSVRSLWDDANKRFNLSMRAQNDAHTLFSLTGNYVPAGNYVDLTGTFDRFPLVHLEPLFAGVLTQVEGSLSGNAHLYGNLNNPAFAGDGLHVDRVAATVDYLKTRYSFSAPVWVNATAFGFTDAEVSDGSGGLASLSVQLKHQHFRQIQYEVVALPRNLCVLRTTEKDNAFFYGRAFASGRATIKGRPGETRFDIDLQAERHSYIRIPASTPAKANDAGLLSFAEPPKDSIDDLFVRPKKQQTQSPANLDIALNVRITPDTEIQIELDKRTGDIIHSHGNGTIKMEINPATDKFNLFGNYVVERGDYLFSIQNFNLITKKFYIEQGGRISFNGDIRNTNLDLTALYKTKASLNSLLSDSSSVVTRRPVDCKIYITGNMLNPALRFDVDVQSLDVETRARVQSALSTEEKMMRQFLALMVFGTFIPDQELTFNTGVAALGSATELLSNQVNNMLNQLNVPLDIGFTYMPSQQGRNEAYDMNFSTQLLNDRLTINGSFGSGNSGTQSFANDFNADIRLSETGKFYFKLFTRSVDQYTDIIDNSQRYGIGLMYQEEFSTFGELYYRIFGRRKKDAAPADNSPSDTGDPSSHIDNTPSNAGDTLAPTHYSNEKKEPIP